MLYHLIKEILVFWNKDLPSPGWNERSMNFLSIKMKGIPVGPVPVAYRTRKNRLNPRYISAM